MTTHLNRLPSHVFCLILERLPIKNKFLFKAVCKEWHSLLTTNILPKQEKLSFEDDYSSVSRCIHPDHQFKFRGNNSMLLPPVRAIRNRKRFFEKEVTGVKVIKFCEGQVANEVMKYCVSEELSSSLQCLDVLCLEKPLVKVLPNLQHFSADRINLVPFASVLRYCPVLTHLSIDMRGSSDDFVYTLMKLPKGLKYLNWEGRYSDLLAVLCSPAMETLESLLLESSNFTTPSLSPIYDARVRPAPRLQRFALGWRIIRQQHRRMIIDFLKECPALKKIDLRVTGLTLEDYVNIYSQLSNLEMINLVVNFDYDDVPLNRVVKFEFDVIRMILRENRSSLKHFTIGYTLLRLKSMMKLAEFTDLQTIYFYYSSPSNEQLMDFAQRRLKVSQSRLQLKIRFWNADYSLDSLGAALQDANIELVAYQKYPSVMD